ncbi:MULTISPECIES: TM2 domain-containing protein [Virgibacillus]|nr:MULTISPECIES: TM2 domain-containing protein [Virgibacillus]MEB5451485.1 TM2 domain-containing protein [Virgibacillus pantothenticus]MEB5455512.1 TM2 domain-containing protein [Virgibacillus pantothenticus]MEB5459663.1 TM2 domain-containing protein [Virgibacillus pantothenticus]MEB5463818.1 TM2 domain-containing protein [Virgibacillus pantothenticus]MEB5468355.1 TM2 domain-containing protein [Virgibacillus pantothenticus]
MELTNEERMLVNSELNRKGKNMLLAYVLLIFLGSLGIHRFYLNRKGSAIAQLLLSVIGWITVFIIIGFIPLAIVYIWLFVDLFLIPGMVNRENEIIEKEIIQSLR